MTRLVGLEEFVGEHRPHGKLRCDATEAAWNGYRLIVHVPVGVVFERWQDTDHVQHLR